MQTSDNVTLAIHGIKFDNIFTAIKAGGFASPSLAAIKAAKKRSTSNEIFSFSAGDILVGFDPSILFNGKKKDSHTLAYTGDFYSSRAPIEHTVLSKAFLKKIEKDSIELNSPYINNLYNLKLEKPDREWSYHLDSYTKSPLMKHLYLSEIGIDLPIPTKANKLESNSLAHYLKTNKIVIDPNLPQDKIIDTMKSVYIQYVESKMIPLSDDPSNADTIKFFIDDAKNAESQEILKHFSNAHRLINSAIKNPRLIDTKKLGVNLERAIKKHMPDFLNWSVSNLIKNTSQVYYKTECGKKLNSLQSVVSYIKKNNEVGSESSLNFSTGELLSYSTKRLFSLDELLLESSNLTTTKDENVNKELEVLFQKLKNFVFENIKSDHDEYDTIKKIATTLCYGNGDVMSLPIGFGICELSFLQLSELNSIADDLKYQVNYCTSKKPYFELVVSDAVSFDSVEFLVVPKGQEVAINNQLISHGINHIKIKTYNTKIPESQLRHFPSSMCIENHVDKLNNQMRNNRKKNI